MKKMFLSFCVAGLAASTIHGQLKIDNATFFIGSGATVTVQGDVTSNVDIQGPGALQLKGTAAQNVDMGGFTIPNLEIDNATANINFTSNAIIGTSLLFTNGKAQLNGNDLRVAETAGISGVSSSKFIITNGTGRLIKNVLGASPFTFPVGYSAAEFNPLTITNSGTADDIGVRCMQDVLDQGSTGSPVIADFAGNSWVVTETTAGGSNLALTGEWAGSDELTNFNRDKSGIARYNTGTDWDLPASNVIAAAGSGPYNRSRSDITSTGVFAIADLEKVNAAKLSLKVFLQGAYDAGTGLMKDVLRDDPISGGIDPVIPTTQPYGSALSTRFERVGIYDGSLSVNEIIDPSIFNVTGNDAVVDWVYVAILDASNPSTKLQTRAALLQRDGDIVDLDGISPLSMPIDVDGNYHFVVGHRNHLSVRTPVAQGLADNAVLSYNMTDAQNRAFQDGTITTNTAMKDLGSGIFVLWCGNANANNLVRYAGPSNDPQGILLFLGSSIGAVVSNVYSNNDVNMDRRVRYAGSGNDPGFLLSNALGSLTGHVIKEHL